MKRWIVLLRAVNVGGTAKLPMAALRDALTAAGFENVQSYIASGNLILDSADDEAATQQRINGLLQAQFGLSGARTLLRDVTTLQRLIKTNPFSDTARHHPEKLHVHFLLAAPQPNAETNLTSYKGPERLRLDGQHLTVDYVNGAGTSSLTARFLETALGTTGTSRNWNTVLKLAEMATDPAADQLP
jgi:uncharacterized protein (DUF1697 family)